MLLIFCVCGESISAVRGAPAAACTVQINTIPLAGEAIASGVVVSHDGATYLVSAYHHLLNTSEGKIVLPGKTILLGSANYFETKRVGGVDTTAYCDPFSDLVVFRLSKSAETELTDEKSVNFVKAVNLVEKQEAVPGEQLIAAGNRYLDFRGGVKKYFTKGMSFGAIASRYDNIRQILDNLPDETNAREVLVVESLSIDKGFSGGSLVVGSGSEAGKLAGVIWGGSLTETVRPGRFAWAATANQIRSAIEAYDNGPTPDQSIPANLFIPYGTSSYFDFPASPYASARVSLNSGVRIEISGVSYWWVDQGHLDKILTTSPFVEFHFDGVVFDHIDFSAGRLVNAEFSNCQFRNCQFARASLNGCSFIDCSNNDRPLAETGFAPLLCYGVVVTNGETGIQQRNPTDSVALPNAARPRSDNFVSYMELLSESEQVRQAARALATPERVDLVRQRLSELEKLRMGTIGKEYYVWTLEAALLLVDLALTQVYLGDLDQAEVLSRRLERTVTELDEEFFSGSEGRQLRNLQAMRNLLLREHISLMSGRNEPPQSEPMKPNECPTSTPRSFRRVR
ncbi:pentapeptide repeat-containing protein [bacterium]|nr:pentapeptide repeat-containing protein [bacterium]